MPMTIQARRARRPRVSSTTIRKVRSVVYPDRARRAGRRFLVYGAVNNAIDHLQRAHIASGFGFWNDTAGFDISQTLIAYHRVGHRPTAGPSGSGLLNTLLVAGLGIVLATILGFIIGIARLSTNWLRRASSPPVYVEIIRNIPLLLQLLFWYNAVLEGAAGRRDSLVICRRRLSQQPRPDPAASRISRPGFDLVSLAFARRHRRHHRRCTSGRVDGRCAPASSLPVVWLGLALIVGLPLLAFSLTGGRSLRYAAGWPLQHRRRLRAAARIRGAAARPHRSTPPPSSPRSSAPASSRSRAGRRRRPIRSACAPRPTLRLIVIPQAMRVIIPPLTNQYLNLTKNSSLAVAIGYPDLVQVFTGTVLNQTGQAVEVVAITMLVYLTISLVTSLAMNLVQRRVALVER